MFCSEIFSTNYISISLRLMMRFKLTISKQIYVIAISTMYCDISLKNIVQYRIFKSLRFVFLGITIRSTTFLVTQKTVISESHQLRLWIKLSILILYRFNRFHLTCASLVKKMIWEKHNDFSFSSINISLNVGSIFHPF